MINVKLLVLFVCINNVRECYSDYCKLCPRHTLCMYKNPGPGPYCSSYDKTALLTKEDVDTIINKINQRRNFVALGLARNLPSAANMNKMRWSEELAAAAQRWADQCDPAIRPDKKDLCRDMVDTKVGQNIATVTGLSPGLNVKSFVEMWYMQALEYTGSVTYYNQSEESKTNYFTQLIWAETALVGCGKARFSIVDKGTMVDRFVCNFAPKGNVRGKPVYTIGYPATQCKENSQKDDIFTGLCRPLPEKTQKTSVAPTESSLLRIINLPNNPVKMDIDPLGVDYKNREMNQDVLNFMRHQNLRHIPNNTRGLIHHVRPLKQQHLQELTNIPRHEVISHQHPFEHPQNVHGAMYATRSPIEQYRNNDYMREMANPSYYDSNVRRRTFSGQCTRNSETTHDNNACKLTSSQIEQCTRTAKKRPEYILTTQPCCTDPEKNEHKTVHACNSQKPACIVNPTTMPYDCNFNCRCLNVNHPRTENHRRIPGEYSYYDYPNLALRGGEEFESKRLIKHSDSSQIDTSFPQDQNDVFTDGLKILEFNDQKTQRQPYRKNIRNRNHPHFINPGHRPKRQIDRHIKDISFWKVDKSDKMSQKRTPRYTTLRNNIKNKFRTKVGEAHINTESITITVGDFNAHRHDSTDRSLSFEELMHFRKNRGGELVIDLRRKNKNNKTLSSKKLPKPTQRPPKIMNKKGKTKIILRQSKESTTTASTTTPTTTSTTKMTIIGSFSPQSACTRRITCTWTMPVITDANGNVIPGGGGGGGGGGGSGGGFPNGRTPWGHVENCTRKYTCSRLFYNRNVQASDTAAGDITPPDEDYCERRALNVKRKDAYGSGAIQTLDHHIVLSESSSPATPSMKPNNNEHGQADCSYIHQESREKRGVTCKHKGKKDLEYKGKKKVRPNNLYFLAFSKILQMWENNRNKPKNYPSGCHCNGSATHTYTCHLFIILILYVY